MAYRRAVEHANGWYGFSLDVAATETAVEGLRHAGQRHRRPAELGDLEISVTPRVRIDVEKAKRYAELGVHRLVLLPPRNTDLAGLKQFVSEIGETLIGNV